MKCFGEFITHTGFAQLGANGDFVYRDFTLLGSTRPPSEMIFRFGFNIRFVERYSTIKNYTIGESV